MPMIIRQHQSVSYARGTGESVPFIAETADTLLEKGEPTTGRRTTTPNTHVPMVILTSRRARRVFLKRFRLRNYLSEKYPSCRSIV